MSDWGPVFVAVMLFILLTPGLLIQVPGKSRYIEFGNFQTSGLSILVHSIIYFALICIFLLAVGVHIEGAWQSGTALERSQSPFCCLDIEVDMKNNKKQDEEQSIESSMHKYGCRNRLHVPLCLHV
ncbi:hypothetical protein REPUB_Repub10bG0009900 [Reevesia pubescens]